MNRKETAVLFVGLQNDYFLEDGILRPFVENPEMLDNTLKNVGIILNSPLGKELSYFSTPINFTSNYEELEDPVGILKVIKEKNAFKKGSKGSEVVPLFNDHSDRITFLDGKRGLNCFSNTGLYEKLLEKNIKNIVLCGAITSICIDSTGRAASEKGFKVFVLEDAIAGRTLVENEFYCSSIFPIYGECLSTEKFLNSFE